MAQYAVVASDKKVGREQAAYLLSKTNYRIINPTPVNTFDPQDVQVWIFDGLDPFLEDIDVLNAYEINGPYRAKPFYLARNLSWPVKCYVSLRFNLSYELLKVRTWITKVMDLFRQRR